MKSLLGTAKFKMKLAVVCIAIFASAFGAEIEIDATLNWRVVGGAPAYGGLCPYIVSLRSSGSHNCGGCIIHRNWILTAAHCVASASTSSLTVDAGSLTLNPGGTRYSVSTIIRHPAYNSSAHMNDIAVLYIPGGLNLNSNVTIIPLETQEVGNVEALLCGWGTTQLGGPIPNNLQYLYLRTLTLAECRSYWGSLIQPQHVCTLTRSGQGACHGDSGGPLAANGKLIGLVSFGNPCANGYPDVFVRVSYFVPWIRNVTGI